MASLLVSSDKRPAVKIIGLTVLAFVFSSFLVQALSHFVLNVAHYATISFMRAEPIMPLGLFVMVVQGTTLAILFNAFMTNALASQRSVMRSALLFSLLVGLFLGAYIAVVEPAKYAVPSVGKWIAVEASASFLQFLIFGVLLGIIHKKQRQD